MQLYFQRAVTGKQLESFVEQSDPIKIRNPKDGSEKTILFKGHVYKLAELETSVSEELKKSFSGKIDVIEKNVPYRFDLDTTPQSEMSLEGHLQKDWDSIVDQSPFITQFRRMAEHKDYASGYHGDIFLRETGYEQFEGDNIIVKKLLKPEYRVEEEIPVVGMFGKFDFNYEINKKDFWEVVDVLRVNNYLITTMTSDFCIDESVDKGFIDIIGQDVVYQKVHKDRVLPQYMFETPDGMMRNLENPVKR